MARDVVDTLSIQINTSASSAIKNIDQLQKRLQSLAKTLSTLNGMKVNLGGLGGSGGSGGGSTTKAYTRLSAAFNAASQASSAFGKAIKTTGSIVGTVSKKILGHFGLIGKGAQAMFTVADGIKSVIGGLIGFKAISGTIGFLRESIQYGADITEIDHIVESVFGNMSSAVNNFAEESIEKFGLAAASAKQYAGFLSAMFQASNIDYKTAGEMGANLTALAGDLSAFFNISQDEAFEKIRAGMSGMVRPLRAIGIDLTAATLSEYALAQGIQKSYTEMTQAEKVMLRYNYLMDHTRTQQGDFQRTQYSMANATRTLTAYTKSLQTAIGEGLVAAIRPAVVALNTLMKGLLVVARAFATFMQTIFGKYKGGASGIAVDLGESDEYMDDLAGGAGAAADSLDSAAGSAKQLKKDLSVLPFDELNQLNKDREVSDSGSGGGGAGGGGGLADFGLSEGLLNLGDYLGGDLPDAISEWARRIRRAFDQEDWEKLGSEIAWGINEGLDKLYDAFDAENFKTKVSPFIDAVTTSFNSLVDNIDWDKLGRVVGAAVNNVVFALNRLIDPKTGIDWANIGKKLALGANGLVSEVNWETVGNLLGNKAMIIPTILANFAKTFDWTEFGSAIGTTLNGFFDKYNFSTITGGIATFINGIFSSMLSFAQTVDWGKIADNISGGLNEFFNTFDWVGNAFALNTFVNNLLGALLEIARDTDWVAFGRGIGDFISSIDWWGILTQAFEIVKEVIGGIWSGLGESSGGRFARGVILAMGAIKIGSALMPFINNIAAALVGDRSISVIAVALEKAFAKAAGGTQLMLGGLGAKGSNVMGSLGITGVLQSAFDHAAKTLDWAGLQSSISTTEVSFDALRKAVAAVQESTGEDVSYLESEINRIEEYGGSAQDALTQLNTAISQNAHLGSDLFSWMNSDITVSTWRDAVNTAIEDVKTAWQTGVVEIGSGGNQIQITYADLAKSLDTLYEKNEISASQYEHLREQLNFYASAHVPVEEAYARIKEQADTLSATTYPELKTALQEMRDEGVLTETEYQNMYDSLMAQQRAGQTAGEAYNHVKEKLYELEETHKAAVETASAKLTEFETSTKTALESIGGSWGNLTTEEDAHATNLMESLDEQIQSMHDWETSIATLTRAGVDEGFLNELVRMGESGKEEIKAALEQVNKEGGVEELNAKWKEYIDAKGLMDDVGADLKEAGVTNVAEAFGVTTDEVKKQTEQTGKAADEGIADGLTSTENLEIVKEAAEKVGDDLVGAFDRKLEINSPSRVMAERGKNIDQGIVNGLVDTGKLSQVKAASETVIEKLLEPFKDIGDKFKAIANTSVNALNTAIGNALSSVTTSGEGVARTLQSGIVDYWNNYGRTAVSDIGSYIRDAFNLDLYEYGQAAARTFANGIQSVWIPTPHVYTSRYNTVHIGDESVYIPEFAVQWYKAGGLFRGGQGQVIGIAEGGKDEAVLPLENTQAMREIAGAILNGMQRQSAGTRELPIAIADAMVNAMARNPQTIDFHNETVLMMQGDVLARHVDRELRQLEQRYRPA